MNQRILFTLGSIKEQNMPDIKVMGKVHLVHYKGELSNGWNIPTMDDLTCCSGELIMSGRYSSSRCLVPLRHSIERISPLEEG